MVLKHIDATIISNKRHINQALITFKTNETFSILAGQFINVFVKNHFLGIPLAVFHHDKNSFQILVKALGKGSKELFDLNIGDKIKVNFPLSIPTQITDKKNVLVLGGGVGIATINDIAKALPFQENATICLAFRKKEDVFLVDYYQKQFTNVHVCCDEKVDGIFYGNCLELIKERKIEFDFIYACGSFGLLKAVNDKFKDSKEGLLLMEARMACGYGICNGCTIKTQSGIFQKVCENTSLKLGEL